MTDHEAKARELWDKICWIEVKGEEAIPIIIAALREAEAEHEKQRSGLVAQHAANRRDYMNICEDLSRKLEEARGRIGTLESQATQEQLWKLTPDEHRDYLEARYKSVSHDLEHEKAENASLRELLFHKDARIAELEAATGGREMWAIWNSCNGVFEVANWRRDALNIIAEAYSEHETVVPVRVFVEDEDRHWLRHAREDEREVLWSARNELEGKSE